MSEPPVNSNKEIYGRMLVGSLWALAMRWGIRSIGLISIVILARVLTPADFGIIAMASLLTGLIDVFVEMGTALVLLRQRDITRADCDTAWTLRLIQGAVLAFALIVSAPFAAQYFSEPRLLPVIFVFAVCAFIGGASNIGMILIRRELDFAKDFRYGIYLKLAVFFPTILFAALLRNYWALVLGHVVGTLAGFVISYRMHPYRPRLSMAKARQYWSFSITLVSGNVAQFLRAKFDVLFIGGYSNSSVMGSYNVASELATMATQEIAVPVWRALFPTFAKLTHDHERFVAAFGHYLSTMAILCFPLGLGLGVLAEEFVMVLLGEKWKSAVTPLQWLAVCSTIIVLIDAFSGSILFVSGHERQATLMRWIHLALTVALVVAIGRSGSAEAVAIAVTLSAAIALPISVIVLMHSLKFPPVVIGRALWRPAASVGVMVAVLKAIPLPALTPVALHLAMLVLIGAILYLGSLTVLWLLAGRPAGPEKAVWEATGRAYSRLRGR